VNTETWNINEFPTINHPSRAHTKIQAACNQPRCCYLFELLLLTVEPLNMNRLWYRSNQTMQSMSVLLIIAFKKKKLTFYNKPKVKYM
jgi:hypothetical protein